MIEPVAANNTNACRGYNRKKNCTLYVISTLYPMSDAFFDDSDAHNAITSLKLVNDTGTSASIVFQLYSLILNRYFQFNARVREEVESLLSEYKNRYLIGFHIRMGDTESDFKETVHFIYKSDIIRFVNCSFIDQKRDPVFYVASDSSMAKAVIRMHAKNAVYQNATAAHSGREIWKGHVASGLYGVLVDIMALAKCQFIIGTKGSSLTYLAAALHGHYPYYVTRNTDCYSPKTLTTDIRRLSI